MPLRAIVRALGGDLYDGGRRANVPAPGHSPRDRSVSLLWTGARLVVHGFGAAGWREVLDDLRARGLIDAAGAPPDAGAPSPPQRPPEKRIAIAHALWAAARPLPGTLAERHLRLRGVRRPLNRALRHHPAVPAAVYADAGAVRPALLAAITNAARELTAVEMGFHAPADARRRRRKRESIRSPMQPASSTTGEGAGVETTYAVAGYFAINRRRHARRDPRLSASLYLTAPAKAL